MPASCSVVDLLATESMKRLLGDSNVDVLPAQVSKAASSLCVVSLEGRGAVEHMGHLALGVEEVMSWVGYLHACMNQSTHKHQFLGD